MQEERKRFH